jgi:oligo-1,6-glucosidase
VAHGDFTMLLPEDEQVYAFTRAHDGVELLVAANFSGEPARAELELNGWADAELLHTNLDGVATTPAREDTGPWDGSLEPWEARVLRRPVNS